MTIQVRQTTYRCERGWLICGTNSRGQRLRVFHKVEKAARAMAQKYRADPDYDSLADPEAWTGPQ